jgi:hypothetical protein
MKPSILQQRKNVSKKKRGGSGIGNGHIESNI